jgi:hypothetical protein
MDVILELLLEFFGQVVLEILLEVFLGLADLGKIGRASCRERVSSQV